MDPSNPLELQRVTADKPIFSAVVDGRSDLTGLAETLSSLFVQVTGSLEILLLVEPQAASSVQLPVEWRVRVLAADAGKQGWLAAARSASGFYLLPLRCGDRLRVADALAVLSTACIEQLPDVVTFDTAVGPQRLSPDGVSDETILQRHPCAIWRLDAVERALAAGPLSRMHIPECLTDTTSFGPLVRHAQSWRMDWLAMRLVGEKLVRSAQGVSHTQAPGWRPVRVVLGMDRLHLPLLGDLLDAYATVIDATLPVDLVLAFPQEATPEQVRRIAGAVGQRAERGAPLGSIVVETVSEALELWNDVVIPVQCTATREALHLVKAAFVHLQQQLGSWRPCALHSRVPSLMPVAALEEAESQILAMARVAGGGRGEGKSITPAPKFSIVIPAKDMARWIGKALSTITAQDFGDVEVIVVCDSCQDQTADVVRSYGFDPVEVNVGSLGDARNVGMALARGEYLLFLDADDYYLGRSVLSTLSEAIDSMPGVDVLHFDFMWGEGQRYRPVTGDGVLVPMVWCRAWRRELVKDIKFTTRMPHEDVDFCTRILQRPGVRHGLVPSPLLQYLYPRPDSIMGKWYKQDRDEAWRPPKFDANRVPADAPADGQAIPLHGALALN